MSEPGGRTRQLPPFYCPYCGEETIRPRDTEGEWHCGSCLRTFALRTTGTGVQQP